MKRTLAIILTLVLLLGALPLTVFAADVDTADTGTEELSIIQQPANCYIYNSLYKPYLRFSVAGATANTTYEWYYDLDDEYAVGEKIATTKVPELQVNKIGWYRCWVKDTNGQSLITQSALVRDTKDLSETSLHSKSRFRINGTMLQWKESPLVDAFGYECVRYTLGVIRHDNTHDSTSSLNFKIQYFSSGNVRVNRFSGSTIIGDSSEQYPATFDSTKKIFSMDLRNIIGQDQNYSDITYQFLFYTNVFNGDFSTNIIRDSFSMSIYSGEYTAKELYNGEVYYNIGGQYDNEVWIEDKEYTVGDTLYANIYGGRWADKFPSVKWQRVDSHGNWLDTGTIGKNYTVTDADVVNERINRIRCVVIPYIGRISGEVYFDDEIFVSNAVDVKKNTCTVTFDKNGGSGTMNSVTVDKGTSYKLPECTFTPPANKQFKNWKIGSSYYKAGDTVTVNSNITAYAQWEDAKSKTVTFSAGYGSGKMEPVILSDDQVWFNIPKCTFTPPKNMEFDCWETVPYDGNHYPDKGGLNVYGDIKLEAQWKRTTNSITVVDCTVTAPEEGELPSYTFSVPENQGYKCYTYNGDEYTNGVMWYNVTDGHFLRSYGTETFKAGKQYLVRLSVVKDGYYDQFDTESLKGFVNGNEGTISYCDSGEAWVDYTFTVPTDGSGSTVSGSYTSYIDSYQATKIELLQNDTVKYATASSGNSGSYSIPNVANGTYTLRVSKKNHVTRDYAITVSGNTTQDVKIHPLGDINGDGKVNNFDAGRVNSHARSKSTLTDYEFKCGDIDGNGKINNFDYGKINSHARGKSSLWT